jgi:DnaJ-class molecular chaperone
MDDNVRRKVEDPELRCPRCDGTGQIDETKHRGSFGRSTEWKFGACDDCGGSGHKPVDNSQNANK